MHARIRARICNGVGALSCLVITTGRNSENTLAKTKEIYSRDKETSSRDSIRYGKAADVNSEKSCRE